MIFAILTISFFAIQNLACKEYGRRFPDTLISQLWMTLGTVAIVTVIMACMGGAKPLDTTGYLVAAAFGLVFVSALICMTLAMSCGHMGITLLIQNSSLLVPTIFGIIVWKESLTVLKGVGIVMIVIMLILSAGDLSASEEDRARYAAKRKKWVLYTSIAFLSDSALSILQGVMGRSCGEVSSETFTFWTSVFSMFFCLILMLILRCKHVKEEKPNLRKNGLAFAICTGTVGIGTAVGNLCSILSLAYLPGVLFYPLRQGSLVLIMWALGVLLYHEKAGKRGIWMLIIGLAGLVLLNL